MSELREVGRGLFWIGLAVAVLGIYLAAGGRLPPLGRLPGDIVVRREGFTLWIPITSAILVSLALTLALRLFARR